MSTYEEQRAEKKKRKEEIDEKIAGYLSKLIMVYTLEDLMSIIRDAAGWAKVEHEKDRRK